MADNLVIVESPAKAKTIKKYLGKDFEVLASYGHVRDLVPKEGAVDPEHGFAMQYQVLEKNERHVEAIARALRKSKALYLATDPDREGEAIAWHLKEILKARGELDGKDVHRVVFYEITKNADPRGGRRSRATCRWNWSTRSRRGARSTIWSASISRRCCGRKCGAGSRPGACRVAGAAHDLRARGGDRRPSRRRNTGRSTARARTTARPSRSS